MQRQAPPVVESIHLPEVSRTEVALQNPPASPARRYAPSSSIATTSATNQTMEQQGSRDAQQPLPCANNCGFFGSPATRNLCSKCFRDSLRRAEAQQAEAAMPAAVLTASSSGAATSTVYPVAVTATATATATEDEEEKDKERVKGRKTKSRCAACGRKVGLVGFECRCGGMFCGAHRYSDRHDCSYDYRGAGRDAIARANPIVRANKQVDKL